MIGSRKFAFVCVALSVLLKVQGASASQCFIWPQDTQVNASMVTQYLDCLAQQPQLTRLSAQWIVLKKSLFQLVDGNSGSFSHRYAANLMDPTQRNTLTVGFNRFTGRNFANLLTYLETEVFPEALKGFTSTPENNKTSWSFEAIAYQNVAFNEDPVRPEWPHREGLNPGGRSYYYAGTILESAKFKNQNWYPRHASVHLSAQLQLPNFEANIPALRAQMQRLGTCDNDGDCLVRQEKTIAQGLFMTLEHPALVDAVHFQRHAGFGLNSAKFPRAQEMLPQTLGCAIRSTEKTLPKDVVITGYMFMDHSMMHLVPYGRYGFLGRAIYIEGINKQDIKSMDLLSGQFQGQNALIRAISDQAVQSFASLNGWGGKDPAIKRMPIEVPFNNGQGGATYYTLDWQLAPGENLHEIMQTRLAGASQQIAYRQTDANPFFTQTIISFGLNISEWVSMLKRLNQPVHYYAYTYDYGLRSAPRNVGWKSYYDRVVWVAQNMFPKIAGVP